MSGIFSSFSITVSTTNCVEEDAASCNCWVLWRFFLNLSLPRFLFRSRCSSCVNWLCGGPRVFCCLSLSRLLFRRFFSEVDNAKQGITLNPFNTIKYFDSVNLLKTGQKSKFLNCDYLFSPETVCWVKLDNMVRALNRHCKA